MGFDAADGGDDIGDARCDPFHGERAFRGGGERVAAQAHRNSSGMARHSRDLDPEAIAAVDRADHADGEPACFEDRPLLDVQFHVGEHVIRLARSVADALGIEPESEQRIAHRCSGSVGAIEHGAIERAGDRAAARERDREAHALLVREADDLDGERQAPAARMQIGDAFDRRDDTEHPVVLAGIAHRVEMRAQHQAGSPRRLAFVASDDIADRVDARRPFPLRASTR